MWAILVTRADGTQEYLKQGTSDTIVARFASRREADNTAALMHFGMDDDDKVESIHVVDAPLKGGKS